MRAAPDVIVIGDGLVGLFTAEALVRRRLTVTVVATPRAGSASDAAAGMLGWRTGSKAPGAAFELGRRSAEAWQGWVARLGGEAALGHRGGTLVLGSAEELRLLDASLRWQAEVPGAAAVLALEPAELAAAGAGEGRHGRLFQDEHALDPRCARAKLVDHCRAAGVAFVETAISALVESAGRVRGVRDEDGRCLDGGAVVLSAGAWSTRLAGLEGAVPVAPVRGQMAVLAPERPPAHVVHLSGGRYLVPRRDGRVLVGSTEEQAGFEVATTAEALDALTEAAVAGWPGLKGAPRIDGWAGLRPTSPDRIPVVGPAERPGLWFATGHGRNGVLFAPVTGEILGRWIADGEPEPLVQSWSPARFGL